MSEVMSGDFAFAGTGTCGPSLAAGGNCTYSVKFTPTASGPRAGAITITDNAPGSPHTVGLTGTGGTGSSDTTPPSIPGGLSASTASSSQINLSWSASTDNVGVAGYKILKNSSQIATTSSTSYAVTGLSASTNYSFAVSAYDAAGNNSLQSNTVSATTQAGGSGGGGGGTCGSGCNNYYVSAGGSGTACSSGNPCSLSQALSSFALGSAGTVIHVAAGTYAAGITVTRGGSSPSVRLILQCDAGSASATVAIGQCKVTGASQGFEITGNNLDIVGFDVGGNSSMGTGIGTQCSSSGPAACTTGNSVHIIGNYVHDLGASVNSGCPVQGAIQMNNQHGHYMTDSQALRNLVAFFGFGASHSGCNTAQGIYSDNPGAIVEGNVVIGIPAGGIQDSAPCSTVVSNNVVMNTQLGIILETADSAGCSGGNFGHNTITNNYVGDSAYHIFNVSGVASCTASTPNLLSHNMSDGLNTEFSGGPFSCETNTPSPWTHQAGASFFANYQTTGLGNYHLKSGSAGIGAGSTSCVSGGTSPCTPSLDFEGNAYTNPPSVGAYK